MKNRIKVTVVGDGDTGKTCMFIVYKHRIFPKEYIPNVLDYYTMMIPINNQEYSVILQDTAGQEEYDQLRQLAYKETDVFILCYAVNDINSMENVRIKWAPELRKCCPRAKIILAGTKSDLQQQRIFTEKDGLKLLKTIRADGFIENSAKSGRNIDETICLALNVVVNNNRRERNICATL